MAQFSYKAKDAKGVVKSGMVRAKSKADAKKTLARMRLKPVEIVAEKLDKTPKKQGGDNGKKGEIPGLLGKFFYRDDKGQLNLAVGSSGPTSKDLVIFTKQFATMIASGVPLVQAMSILAGQQRVRNFGITLDEIRNAVENGATLSESLEAFPKIFDSLYVSMVRAGEQSGSLDTILMRLVTYIEKAAKIKSQVKGAMMYPMIVVVVAVSVVAALLLFVVPTFAKQYEDGDRELPGLTAAVVNASNFLAEYWYVVFGGMAIASYLFKMYINTEKGRIWYDNFILKVPGIGQLLRKVSVGRFCSTMATMLSSGVNMLDALTICSAASGNKTIESFILYVRGKIEQGSPMSEPLAEGSLFPAMVVSMVSVGEATGALDDMLVKVAEFYDDEVDLAVKTVLSMIEPVLIVFIGTVVGTIVIAMYLPVFDMGNIAQ